MACQSGGRNFVWKLFSYFFSKLWFTKAAKLNFLWKFLLLLYEPMFAGACSCVFKFVSCAFANFSENILLWRVYGPGNEGIPCVGMCWSSWQRGAWHVRSAERLVAVSGDTLKKNAWDWAHFFVLCIFAWRDRLLPFALAFSSSFTPYVSVGLFFCYQHAQVWVTQSNFCWFCWSLLLIFAGRCTILRKRPTLNFSFAVYVGY